MKETLRERLTSYCVNLKEELKKLELMYKEQKNNDQLSSALETITILIAKEEHYNEVLKLLTD
jgi:hypothetical protein